MSGGWTYELYKLANHIDKDAIRNRARQIHQSWCTEPDAQHHPAGAADYEKAHAQLAAEVAAQEVTQ